MIMAEQLEIATLRRDWIEESIDQLVHILKPQSFTADALHLLLISPDHDNWFGAMVACMKKRGLIKEIGWKVSKRRERNGARLILWGWA